VTTWFADDNESTYSGVRNPIVGAVCLGVWKRTGEHTYGLNHIGLSWDPLAASVTPPTRPLPPVMAIRAADPVTLIQVHQIEHREALRREASALQSIAWTDALTGVPNRHFFTEALARAWRGERRAGRQAILMIDIDHFKLLNDRYGHPVGDGCLREVARALQRALMRPDDVLARYGGEEFIVLLRDSSAAGAQAVAERLRATVKDLRIENADSSERVVTVSIGVASAELTDETAAARMVEDADRALYEAKCAGRNQVKLATDHININDELASTASITARRRRLQS
jgi:diguanylate cyclase (GGDEF)-like protein